MGRLTHYLVLAFLAGCSAREVQSPAPVRRTEPTKPTASPATIDADGLEVVAMVTIEPGSLPYFGPIAVRALNSLRITTEGMYDRPQRESQP